MTLSFGSLFSGIGGLDKGLDDAGLECAWQCEIDKAARSVLAKHWPNVPCYEDVKNVRRDNVSAVDLICGGFPCQDVSVAGKRAGLAGERSGLWFEFRRVVEELRPKWVVVENVPGLLSSNGGADFAVILRGLVECGYGVCWRILDAQYFGVAQRRRRVFIVGSLGDGRAAEILFEREGLFGNPSTRGEARQGVTPPVANGINGSGLRGRQPGSAASYVSDDPAFTSAGYGGWREGVGPLRANGGDLQGGSETLIPFDLAQITSKANRTRVNDGDPAWPLNTAAQMHVAYNIQHNDGGQHKRKDRPEGGLYVTETDTALTVGSTDLTAIAYGGNNTSGAIEIATAVNAHGGSGRMDFESETFIASVAPTLSKESYSPSKSSSGQQVDWAIGTNAGVRRLTPVECERLQGFPDSWTASGANGAQSDSVRYRQLGNAVCVNVARWLGERLAAQ